MEREDVLNLKSIEKLGKKLIWIIKKTEKEEKYKFGELVQQMWQSKNE